MQPVHTAAGIDMVAGRPGPSGSAQQEAWAFGHSESFSSSTGQAVFQHHTTAEWTLAGPPVLADGVTTFNAIRVLAMSLAPNGEAWAVLRSPTIAGYQDVFVRHVPGGPWQFDRPSSDQLASVERAGFPQMMSLWLGSPGDGGGGTYGFAVVASDTHSPGGVMRLASGLWQPDTAGGTNSQGQLGGGYVTAVSGVSADEAWAVGSPYAVQIDNCRGQAPTYQECLRNAQGVLGQNGGSSIYHRTGGTWTAVSTTSTSVISTGGVQNAPAGQATPAAADSTARAWLAADSRSGVPPH